MSATLWPKLATLGGDWSKLAISGQHWPISGRCWPNFGRIWPRFAKIWQSSPKAQLPGQHGGPTYASDTGDDGSSNAASARGHTWTASCNSAVAWNKEGAGPPDAFASERRSRRRGSGVGCRAPPDQLVRVWSVWSSRQTGRQGVVVKRRREERPHFRRPSWRNIAGGASAS